MPFVRIKSGHNTGKIHEIKTETLSLGRDTVATIQLVDEAASRNHAEIFRIGEMCFIRDLTSRNGTFVNENKIQEELLRMGDQIRIGNTVMVFEEQTAEEVSAEPNITYDSGEVCGNTVELALDTTVTSRIKEAQDEGPEETGNKHLPVLFELARLMSKARHLKPLLKKIVEMTREAMNAESAYIFIKDASGKMIPMAYQQTQVGGSTIISRSIIKRVIQYGRAVLTSDATLDSRFAAKQSVVINRIRSVICAPLVSRKTFSGVIYLNSAAKGKTFNEDELAFISAVGILTGIAMENLQSFEKQQAVFLGTVRTLVTATEIKDPSLRGHPKRVGAYAAAIAKEMKLSRDEIHYAHIAGLLHDIGMMVMKDATTAGKELKKHAELGAELASNMTGLEEVVPAIKYQHETMNGKGPFELTGDDIPLLARILGVSKSLDRQLNAEEGAPTIKDVLMSLGENEDRRFDDRVLKAMVVAHRTGGLFANEGL